MSEDRRTKRGRPYSPAEQGRSPEDGAPTGKGWFIGRIIVFLFLAMLLMQLFGIFDPHRQIPYSVFKSQLRDDNVVRVTVQGDRIRGAFREETEIEGLEEETPAFTDFVTYFPRFGDDQLMTMLEEQEVTIETRPEREGQWWYILVFLAPLLLLGGLFYMQYQRMQGGRGGIFNIGRSRAKLHTATEEQTTFDDVAGAEAAKEELREFVVYLRHPERIQHLGGQLPKGLLLLGPPGCGKTLLARAVAGEAGVPFYSITGSDFMEMFVGVGASRVRDLFQNAKASAPSIVFIDELDSIGRRRGAGLGGGHDEREQTLNQLLSEMDGFEGSENVVVMAATNRPDVLDPALQRPGRFDRQVVIPLPNQKEREQILHIYAAGKQMAGDVDLNSVSKGTPGFSGADLENLLNEAALMAGRKDKKEIETEDLDEARDKVLMGLAHRGLTQSDEERHMIAYHEAGHAIVSVVLPEASPVHKISIIPRSRAMGVTESFPEEEKYVYKREYVLSQLSVMMGGRCAEEMIYNTATTGAENDLKQATRLARRMVLEWGMSEDLMNIALGREQQNVFLGHELSQGRDYSEATAREVDQAVKNILSQAHDRSAEILNDHRKAMHKLVERLLEEEEIAGSEIEKIISEQ